MGNRIAKHVYNNGTGLLEKSTYYILDAQGQQISMYEHNVGSETVSYYLAERNIYGSSRLGVTRDTINMYDPELLPSYGVLGNRNYELSNHLGNVLIVINDVKIPLDENSDTYVDGYQTGLVNVSDYSSFGVELDGRTIKSDFYRRGYQGSEIDNEVKGEGNSYTTYFRLLDPRVGRWLTIDPKPTPWESPYVSMGNNPIWFNDVLGDKIKNPYEEKNKEAEQNLKDKKSSLDAFGDNTKAVGYGKAKREYNKALNQFNQINKPYEEVKQAISDLEKYNNPLYKTLDNLTYPGTEDVVDVYVHIESGLYSDIFGGTMDDFENRKKLDGITESIPVDNTTYTTFGSLESYLKIKSTWHGENTITIVIDKTVVDKGRVLSHEGGHAVYDVQHMLEYIQWINQNPGKSEGGHGGGNPNGIKAENEEKIYEENKIKLNSK